MNKQRHFDSFLSSLLSVELPGLPGAHHPPGPSPLKPLECLCSLQESVGYQSLSCPPYTDDPQSACGQSQ